MSFEVSGNLENIITFESLRSNGRYADVLRRRKRTQENFCPPNPALFRSFPFSDTVDILYHFVQFGRPLSHLIFSDTVFERFKYFRIFWDSSKNKKCQPLAELIEMVQYFMRSGLLKGPAFCGCAFLCDMCDRDAATYP